MGAPLRILDQFPQLAVQFRTAAVQISAYDSGLKLVRRETIEGSLTFLYVNEYHPGGVNIRNTTDDIWMGANDHRIRRAQMLFTETHSIMANRTAMGIRRYTVTCSYGPVPEIKPPL
jgi:hypothetical protein